MKEKALINKQEELEFSKMNAKSYSAGFIKKTVWEEFRWTCPLCCVVMEQYFDYKNISFYPNIYIVSSILVSDRILAGCQFDIDILESRMMGR